MWTCPACGRPNELHAIFCSSCGVSRHKAAPREAPRYEPVVEPPPPAAPVLRGTTAGFVFSWFGASLLAGVLCAAFGYAASTARDFFASQMESGTLIQLILNIATGIAYGGILGSAQAWVLSRRTGRPGWFAWILATTGGYLVQSIASAFVPSFFLWEGPLALQTTVAGLHGLLVGGLLGVFQTRVLTRILGPGAWSKWWVVSAGLYLVMQSLSRVGWQFVLGAWVNATLLVAFSVIYLLLVSGLIGLGGGFALARLLRTTLPPRASLPSG
jgi:hypothetical protein